ncbi:MAG TPA: electron transfer flavoprotein subunit beta/FixA family protein [Planktothrix sp.]
MKIAVCVKSVPDTEAKINVAADKKNIDLSGVRFIVSPYDELAVEEALKLKEKNGGEAVVFTVGGDEVTDPIRDEVISRGLDSVVHLKDAEFQSLDALGIAKVLAAAIKDGGFDLVLCGQQGVGTDNCQVPAMLAELLDWPQATLVVKLEVEGSTFKAEREIEGAHEIVQGSLPAVISAQKGLNTLRNKGLKGVMAAKKAVIPVKGAADVGVAGKIQRTLAVKEMMPPPERPAGRKLEGDTDTQVKSLVELLRSEARVI